MDTGHGYPSICLQYVNMYVIVFYIYILDSVYSHVCFRIPTLRLPVFRIDRSEGGAQTVELYDYFYPFTPPPDESRQDRGGRI